jgi:hypothetical protein
MRLHRTQLATHSRSGLTLIELALSMGLFGLVMGLGAMVSNSARSAYESTSTSSITEAQVKVALDRIAREIEMGALGTLDPALDGVVTDTSRMSMMQVVDIVNGAIVLGDVLTIGYSIDPRDPVDGVDNDGDGLIDEGHLIMIRDDGGANPQTVTLCRNVRRFLEGEESGAGDENGNGLTNEAGFLIEREGDLLTLQLTVERPSTSGNTQVRTSTTSVLLRNELP